MKLQYYDIIAGTAVDYMHCALLGVTKYLLGLWFNSEHNKENFYIGRSVLLVDKRLKEITPPSIISRKPRAISEHLSIIKFLSLDLSYFIIPYLSCLGFYHLNIEITLCCYLLQFTYFCNHQYLKSSCNTAKKV